MNSKRWSYVFEYTYGIFGVAFVFAAGGGPPEHLLSWRMLSCIIATVLIAKGERIAAKRRYEPFED